jgi:hypothetical protein
MKRREFVAQLVARPRLHDHCSDIIFEKDSLTRVEQ